VREEKVKPFPTSRNTELIEIYQPTGMEFSFLSPKESGNEQAHQFVKCRDYLQDAVRATLHGKAFEVYGFRYDPETHPPIDLNSTRVLVSDWALRSGAAPSSGPAKDPKKRSKWFLRRLAVAKRMINRYESCAGLSERTKALKVDFGKGADVSGTWLLEAPRAWLASPCLISMFTLLVRAGMKNLKIGKNSSVSESIKRHLTKNKVRYEEEGDPDAKYLEKCVGFFETIMKNLDELFLNSEMKDNYPIDVRIRDFHNCSGIVSLCDKGAATPLPGRINDSKKKLMKMIAKEGAGNVGKEKTNKS
jgi:hypothetical protein